MFQILQDIFPEKSVGIMSEADPGDTAFKLSWIAFSNQAGMLLWDMATELTSGGPIGGWDRKSAKVVLIITGMLAKRHRESTSDSAWKVHVSDGTGERLV